MENIGVIFAVVILLAVTALGATIYLFRRRRFDAQGFEKGTAADPDRVRRQNPPDRAH